VFRRGGNGAARATPVPSLDYAAEVLDVTDRVTPEKVRHALARAVEAVDRFGERTCGGLPLAFAEPLL